MAGCRAHAGGSLAAGRTPPPRRPPREAPAGRGLGHGTSAEARAAAPQPGRCPPAGGPSQCACAATPRHGARRRRAGRVDSAAVDTRTVGWGGGGRGGPLPHRSDSRPWATRPGSGGGWPFPDVPRRRLPRRLPTTGATEAGCAARAHLWVPRSAEWSGQKAPRHPPELPAQHPPCKGAPRRWGLGGGGGGSVQYRRRPPAPRCASPAWPQSSSHPAVKAGTGTGALRERARPEFFRWGKTVHVTGT